MAFRADTPARFRLALLWTLLALGLASARADEAAVAAGRGLQFSKHYNGYLLQYYRDAEAARGRNGFFELTAGDWPGPAEATLVAASGGLREEFEQRGYARLSLGAGYIDRTTEHLGTHGQFVIQLAVGREFGRYDAGVCMVHVSNGDFVLHTGKPNDGENFLTVQLGRRF
jgi:hypothetical protein